MFLEAIGKDSFSGPLLPNPQSGLSFLPRELGPSHLPSPPPSQALPQAREPGSRSVSPINTLVLTGPGRAGVTGPTVGSIQTGHSPDSL